ncbi:hypothetical protein [Streptomyces sannanensis]
MNTVAAPPAEVRYVDELAALRAADSDPRPPGRQLSLRGPAAHHR